MLALVAAGLLVGLLLLRSSLGNAYGRVARQVQVPGSQNSAETGVVGAESGGAGEAQSARPGSGGGKAD